MAQATKEPCKKEACDIQACLSKNNFLPQKVRELVRILSSVIFSPARHGVFRQLLPQVVFFRCLKVIELLDSCCAKCNYNSTHCASLSGLLKQKPKG